MHRSVCISAPVQITTLIVREPIISHQERLTNAPRRWRVKKCSFLRGASCVINFNHFICVLPLAFEGIETESDEAKLEIAVLLEGVI